jgi:hypothetical protein
MTLTLVPASFDQRLTAIKAELRAAGFRAICAHDHVAVIIPAPGAAHGHGQYHVAPGDTGLRVRWHATDRPAIHVDLVDTPTRAARLILDHLAGLYP